LSDILVVMKDITKEWFLQSDYDFGTAQAMLQSDRYVYVIFMCHLSLEKAIKGLYFEILNKVPPRSHDLLYIAKQLELTLPEVINFFFSTIDDVSFSTRYPENFAKALRSYSRDRAVEMIRNTEDTITWIKKQLTEL